MTKKNKVNEIVRLTKIHPVEVSVVDHAANLKKFLVVKNLEKTEMDRTILVETEPGSGEFMLQKQSTKQGAGEALIQQYGAEAMELLQRVLDQGLEKAERGFAVHQLDSKVWELTWLFPDIVEKARAAVEKRASDLAEKGDDGSDDEKPDPLLEATKSLAGISPAPFEELDMKAQVQAVESMGIVSGLELDQDTVAKMADPRYQQIRSAQEQKFLDGDATPAEKFVAVTKRMAEIAGEERSLPVTIELFAAKSAAESLFNQWTHKEEESMPAEDYKGVETVEDLISVAQKNGLSEEVAKSLATNAAAKPEAETPQEESTKSAELEAENSELRDTVSKLEERVKKLEGVGSSKSLPEDGCDGDQEESQKSVSWPIKVR